MALTYLSNLLISGVWPASRPGRPGKLCFATSRPLPKYSDGWDDHGQPHRVVGTWRSPALRPFGRMEDRHLSTSRDWAGDAILLGGSSGSRVPIGRVARATMLSGFALTC